MTTLDALVKELRERADLAPNDCGQRGYKTLLTEAATELTRLSARVAELENLCALRADNNRELVAMLDDANNRTESAESRAAAMREALKHYADELCERWWKENGGTFAGSGGRKARALQEGN